MKTKYNWLLALLVTFIVQITFAQEKTISGIVSDDTGPLPGVSIIKKGTSIGTETDFDGKYSIKAKTGDVLLFSFVGMEKQFITVGSSSTINITMQSGNTLDEVVVTAQGIKREAKALGYSIKTLKSASIESKPEGDVARVLSGKVAGVNITATNGLSGSSTNIIIRGFSSITGSNQPLFIVDGVPFDSGANTQSNFLDGNTESSRFLDLDPNLIEDISVLKGLSATVLYGSAGRNGVILITTKNANSGNTNKKTQVTVNQSYFATQAILPKYQNEYGGGFHQGFGFFFSNWGPRFDRTDDDGISNAGQFVGTADNGNALVRHPFNFLADQSLIAGYENLLDAPYEYRPYNGVKDFFRTGSVTSTSIGIRGGSDNVSYSVNYGRNEDIGVTPGNSVLRNNLGMGGNVKFDNGINISGSFNFSKTDYKSPPNAASFGSGTGFDGAGIFGDLLYTPRSVDLTNIPFQAADGRSVYYRSGNDIQNPYWTANNAFTRQETDRFFGSITLSYDFTDWLTASFRSGIDTYSEFNSYGQNRGGVDGEITGLFRTITARNTNWDHNLVFSADKDLNKDFNLKAAIGFNSRRFEYYQNGVESVGQLTFGVLRHYNFSSASSVNSFSGLALEDESNQNTVGVYFDSTLSYKSFLFLNFSARNDWTNTLEAENNSILYPGISVAFLPTDAFEMKGDVLSYMKIRLGYGTSAGFPDPYSTRNSLSLNARAFIDNNGNTISSNSVSDDLGNSNLKPELDQEIEFGIDTRFFNRLGFNVSLYRKKTRDAIVRQELDPSTGATDSFVNLGDILNKGVEVDFDYDVVKPTDNGFGFNLAGNFTANESTIEKLPEGSGNIVLTDNVVGEVANYAVEGRPYGVLLGTTILRDDAGNPIVGDDGLYLNDNSLSEIGDPNPDWTAALIPSFKYKNFSLSANIQYRHGGDIASTTATTLLGRGVVNGDTPINRESNFILPGVNQDGQPNNIAISATELGFSTYINSGINEFSIYDGTTIRLQEISLGYNMPKKYMEKTPFSSLSFTLAGFNLWYRAVNFDKDLNYDTNSSSTGVGNGQGIDFITGPSTRRFGLSVKAVF